MRKEDKWVLAHVHDTGAQYTCSHKQTGTPVDYVTVTMMMDEARWSLPHITQRCIPPWPGFLITNPITKKYALRGESQEAKEVKMVAM